MAKYMFKQLQLVFDKTMQLID